MSDYRTTAAPIVKEFLNFHDSVLGHSMATIDSYYSDLKTFIGWIHLQEHPRDVDAIHDETITVEQLSHLTREDIYAYITWLNRDRGLNAETRARRLSAVKSFYRYLCVETNKIEQNPTAGIAHVKRTQKLPVFLSEAQVGDLLQAPSGMYELRDRTILMLFVTGGLRISELAALDLSSVGSRCEYIKVLGKGSKERNIYLSEPMKKQLRQYLDMRYGLTPCPGSEKALFISMRNQRMSVRRIRSMVNEKCKAAGLDSDAISPHKLRHTAATLLLKNGVDIRVIQEVLGHNSLAVTQRYTHIDDASLRDAAKAISNIGKDLVADTKIK